MNGWKCTHWPALIAAGVAVLVAGDVAAILLGHMFSEPLARLGQTVLDSSALAGWVQAIGSISAIGAGVVVAYIQLRAQRSQLERASRMQDAEYRESKRALKLSKLFTLRAKLIPAIAVLEAFAEDVRRSKPSWGIASLQIDEVKRVVDAIGPEDFPTAGSSVMVGRIGIHLAQFHAMFLGIAQDEQEKRDELWLKKKWGDTAHSLILAVYKQVAAVLSWIDAQIEEVATPAEKAAYDDEMKVGVEDSAA